MEHYLLARSLVEQPVGREILMTVPGASRGASVASGAAERATGVAVTTAAMARVERVKNCIVADDCCCLFGDDGLS